MQTTDDGVKQQDTTPSVVKSRSHFVRAPFDLSKEPLEHVVGANGLPVLLGEGVHKKTVPVVETDLCELALGGLLIEVGREGIEPSRTHRPGDFKSPASTISPPPQSSLV
jgi:hypothetical protein